MALDASLDGTTKMIAQIVSILPLWSRLDGDDKYNFKRLIDHKIGVLSRSFRSAGNSPYELLDRVLDLKTTVGAAGFDLGSVEALITQEVGKILDLNGLEYVSANASDSGEKYVLEDGFADGLEDAEEELHEDEDEEAEKQSEKQATERREVNHSWK